MALPTLNVPYYETTLPCTGRKIKYRPFLVKEEKVLLVAAEDGSNSVVSKALIDVVNACCSEDIHASSLPVSDLEYLFLQIRIKSVGEVVEANIPCQHCEEPTKIHVDLTKVDVNKEDSVDPVIQLTDEVGVKLNYPSMDIVTKNATEDGEIDTSQSFDVVADCIEYIFDKDSTYSSEDHTKEEIIEFLDSLSQKQFSKITDFFSTIPSMTYDLNYKCPLCKKENEKKLEGIQDFFDYASVT